MQPTNKQFKPLEVLVNSGIRIITDSSEPANLKIWNSDIWNGMAVCFVAPADGTELDYKVINSEKSQDPVINMVETHGVYVAGLKSGTQFHLHKSEKTLSEGYEFKVVPYSEYLAELKKD